MLEISKLQISNKIKYNNSKIKESKYLFTVEDHSIIGGLGSAVSEVLTDEYPKKVTRIGLNDVFPESAPPKDLYEKYGLSSDKIADRVIFELDK